MSAQDNDTPRNLYREISNEYFRLRREGTRLHVIALSKEMYDELSQSPEMRLPSDIPQPKRTHIYNTPVIVIDEWEGRVIRYMSADEFMQLYTPAVIEAFRVDEHRLTSVTVRDDYKVLFEYDAMKGGNMITVPFDPNAVSETTDPRQMLFDMATYGLQQLYEYNAKTPIDRYDLWEKARHPRTWGGS